MKWFVAFAIIALAAACSPSAPAKLKDRMPAADTLQYRACTRSEDCVVVNNGCCDCANGGEDLAVAAAQKAAFEAQFACDNVPCTERGGRCGRGTTSCEEGLCQYR